MKYLLEDSVAPQFKAFALGFETVCGGPVLQVHLPARTLSLFHVASLSPLVHLHTAMGHDQLFRGEELEQLICGSADLDFNELEKIAVYLDGYHPQHPTIRYTTCAILVRACVGAVRGAYL